MEREPNLIVSSASKLVVEGCLPFTVDVKKLEDETGWSLEVVALDGTSTVWRDQFDDDSVAVDEATKTLRKEGAAAFLHDGKNVIR